MVVERGRASQRSHGVVSQRSYGVMSQRSYGTSSSSSQGSRAKCKDCCRKFISFMCTQVGVGGLLVSYAILGACLFQFIEGNIDNSNVNLTRHIHQETIMALWEHTVKLNILNESQWQVDINRTLYQFQKSIVATVKNENYDGLSQTEIWNFPAALMFCLSVFSMIGYGHMTPQTPWGKAATIMYAIIGIPLYIVYFMNMGRVFAKTFKFLYRIMYRCFSRGKARLDDGEDLEDGEREMGGETIIVPYTACMWVMIIYIIMGTIMFAEWENWSYIDSWYFSFTSLAKIGIGDLVPGIGQGGQTQTEDSNTKLIINFMYLLIGMGLIAMCYTLMKEEILLKLRALKQEIREKLFMCGLRLGLYQDEEYYPAEIRPPPQPIIHRSRSVRKSVRRR
ncbi:hypothetical protein Pmani_019067 [Petrolisthes manimaculis]|uniref:Potassium channel domain-containing protein n=1 Tax=Petrolisthes manimaculis TaxID=1843537 RepID=A0AAE1PJN3_9EUCA|nr:hypothetical protein Pmani_019067 [Petrolisthes manimaculis]